MNRIRVAIPTVVVCLLVPHILFAQQRPLVTEDPETIGAGLVLIEGGFDQQHDVYYPASGLKGNLLRLPTLGVSFGLSSIAELQIDGGLYNRLSVTSRRTAPLSSLLNFSGDSTHDVEDIVVATKIRVLAETSGRPAFGVRFATRLPNASNESGLGLDTTDFYVSATAGKTVQSIRFVGNVGLGILGDPVDGNRQNDVLTYGASFARAVRQGLEVVGEVNGRLDTRAGDPPVGTESRGAFRLGGRFTKSTVRIDAGLIFGFTERDPSIGLTAGATWVFKGFTIP
jgi:outer membrane putative beta-barrel porin/alpha-amylase